MHLNSDNPFSYSDSHFEDREGRIEEDKPEQEQKKDQDIEHPQEEKTEEPHWERLGSKDYLITAYKDGQEVKLTFEQYKKLDSLVRGVIEEKPALKESKVIHITSKAILGDENKEIDKTNEKTFKEMQKVLKWKPLPPIPQGSKVVKGPTPITEKKAPPTERKEPISVIINLSDFDKNILLEKEINLVTDTRYQLKATEAKHLTLIEQYKYYESFIGKFSGQVKKEIKTCEKELGIATDLQVKTSLEKRIANLKDCLDKLDDLKNKTLQRLVGDKVGSQEEGGSIYSKEWLKPIDKEKAKELWSGKEEGARLKEAKALLSNSMVEAAALLENAGVEDIGTVHYKGCDAIAKDRRAESLNEEGKIEVKREFEITTDKGDKLSAKATTTQFAEKFIGSMEKRIRDPETGKLHGVNIQTERILFKDANGQEVQTTQLRSGSFDMNGIKKFDKDGKLLDQYKLPTTIKGLESEKEDIAKLNAEDLDKYIEEIRIGGNPDHLALLILALKELQKEDKLPKSLDPKGWDHALQKFEIEYSDMKYNQDVIKLNTEVMKDTFRIAAENDKDPQKKLGYKIPDTVQSVLDTVSGLEAGRQNWGMISLQSPVNVANKKGFNKFVASLRTELNKLPSNPLLNKLTKPILKQLDQLVGSDTSELDPVHRELKGYEQACKETGISNGLYINFPTNFIGAEKTIFRIGDLFEIEIPLKSLFNQGLIDKARYNEVVKKTQESTEKLYNQSNEVLTKVKLKLVDPNLKEEDKKSLEHYKNSLESLIDQTFKVEKSLTGSVTISFAMAPGEKAQYEAIGRATALMQLLGYKTTGHCRSGNNRTAAWLSKTYQIFSTMLASPDGQIPSPKETAGKLATTLISLGTFIDAIVDAIEKRLDLKDKLKDDHWSLQTYHETYESSLALQEVNKGTQGTKTKVDEIGDSSYREVLTRGAFDLAGPFNEKALDNKKMKLLEQGKLTTAGIHTFVDRIKKQALMAAVGKNEKGLNDQLKRLENLDQALEKNRDKYDNDMIDRVRADIQQALQVKDELMKAEV